MIRTNIILTHTIVFSRFTIDIYKLFIKNNYPQLPVYFEYNNKFIVIKLFYLLKKFRIP